MKKCLKIFFFLLITSAYAQDSDDLDLLDKEDLEFLDKKEDIDLDELNSNEPPKVKENTSVSKEDTSEELDTADDKQVENNPPELQKEEESSKDNEKQVVEKGNDLNNLEKDDDLDILKEDIGESLFEDKKEEQTDQKLKAQKNKQKVFELVDKKSKDTQIFDVGEEERNLLELSKYIMGKIPEKDWSEIATSSRSEKYVVQKGDWLWKISKKLFGTGFYYSKIWALNPHITNPHEIEPGMVLVLYTGDEDEMPAVRLKEFSDDGLGGPKEIGSVEGPVDLAGNYPDSDWMKKRDELVEQGVFFQYTSDVTYEDLERLAKTRSEEYKSYEPPLSSIIPLRIENEDQEETRGFDKSSRINVNFSEGFYLTTFVTSNIVQDIGELVASSNVSSFITNFNKIFVKFDPSVNVRPGDYYSVYSADGKYEHPNSERSGYRYTIIAQLRALTPKDDLWECEIFDISGIVKRKSRITKYTPKIEKIIKTFSQRTIEGVVIGTTRDHTSGISYGDVIFIDRGRLDGVENGTVFEIFSSVDVLTGKDISIDPSYKIGELTVITLTDNFSTALVTNSNSLISLGAIAVSKSVEAAAKVNQADKRGILKDIERSEDTLDDLDLELKIDDLGEDLLNKADKLELTDDEMEILERQEREQSVIQEHEKDIRELEKLESEIEKTEDLLNEAKIDEDKYLEQQDLNYVEERSKRPDADAFESINEIEKDLGLKFMDEDLNSKENPYGLTENDLEEVDELMDNENK